MYRAELAFGGGLHASRDGVLTWIASLVAPTAAAASPSAVSLGQPPRGCQQDEAATHSGHRSFQLQALHRPPFGGAKLRPWGALPAGTAADELLVEDSPLLASPFSPIALIHTGMEEQASFLSDPALSHQSYSVTQMSACFSDASLPGTPAGAAPPACASAAAVARHVPPSHLVHWAQLLSGAGQPHHRTGALETGIIISWGGLLIVPGFGKGSRYRCAAGARPRSSCIWQDCSCKTLSSASPLTRHPRSHSNSQPTSRRQRWRCQCSRSCCRAGWTW